MPFLNFRHSQRLSQLGGKKGRSQSLSLQAFSTAQGSENIVAKDGVLFSDCGKTLLQYPAGKPNTTYEVPEGTVKLSEWSFEAVQAL